MANLPTLANLFSSCRDGVSASREGCTGAWLLPRLLKEKVEVDDVGRLYGVSLICANDVFIQSDRLFAGVERYEAL